jgi:hypothetical protein
VVIGAVGMFAEPGMFTSVRGGKVVRSEKPKLVEGKLGLEDEVLFVFVGGQLLGRGSGFNVSKAGVKE